MMSKVMQLSPYQVPQHIKEKLVKLGKRYGSQTKAIIVAIELLYEREFVKDTKNGEKG